MKGLDLIAASLIYPYREKLRAGQQRNAPRFGASRVVFKALGHVGCPPRRSHAPALEVRLERGDPDWPMGNQIRQSSRLHVDLLQLHGNDLS